MYTVRHMSQRARVLSSGEAEFCVLNLGCAAESLVRNCWTWMQLEHVNLDGQTRNGVGLRYTRGGEHEVLEVRQRGRCWYRCLCTLVTLGYDGGRFERGKECIKQSTHCSVHDDARYSSGYRQEGHCWWIILHMNLVKVIVALVHLCVKDTDNINSKMQNVGDFQVCEGKMVVWVRSCGVNMQSTVSLTADQLAEHAQSLSQQDRRCHITNVVTQRTHQPHLSRMSIHATLMP